MTTLTLANCELLLVARTSAWLVKADMAITVTGAAAQNADLNDPIGYGIIAAGGSLLSRVLLVDADVATVASANEDKMIDIAELRTLQNVQGNLALIDTKIGPRDEKLGQLLGVLNTLLERKEKRIESLYGLGVPAPEFGNLEMDFAEHDEDNTDDSGW